MIAVIAGSASLFAITFVLANIVGFPAGIIMSGSVKTSAIVMGIVDVILIVIGLSVLGGGAIIMSALGVR